MRAENIISVVSGFVEFVPARREGSADAAAVERATPSQSPNARKVLAPKAQVGYNQGNA